MKRRQFLTRSAAWLAAGGAAMSLPQSLAAAPRRFKAADPRGTARNLIFVFLDGGPSHVDTFDLKTDRSTPDWLGAGHLGGFDWPLGLMPRLAESFNDFSILRSISAVEAVHERAAYHLLTGHRQNPAAVGEVPHFSAMLSYYFEPQRRERDSLPTVTNLGLPAYPGFLADQHEGLTLGPDGRIEDTLHEFDDSAARFNLLEQLKPEYSRADDPRYRHLDFQEQGLRLMYDTELHQLLGLNDNGEPQTYEGPRDLFLQQVQTTVRLLAADRGTRVVRLNLPGWDHHDYIYQSEDPFNLRNLGLALDEGLALLFNELKARPGRNADTLFDETLIVAMGEFGRTTGELNASFGRDHYPYVTPALLAGGGIRGGQILGATTVDGSAIIDSGWSQSRYITISDVVATIYSALGIDWSARFSDTPSGRIFEMVDSSLGPIYDIAPLFS